MKESYGQTIAVLISMSARCLEAEGITFIVADADMSVLKA